MLPFNVFLVAVSVVIAALRADGLTEPSYQAAAHMWIGYTIGVGITGSLVARLFRLPSYFANGRKLRVMTWTAYTVAAALTVVEAVAFVVSH